MNKKVKFCPFGERECKSDCALYIDPNELNETVKNKLASVGVIDREEGICSLKNMALNMSRHTFESTGIHRC